MFKRELDKRREIRGEYNALLTDLQREGHRFRIKTENGQEGLGAPLWKPWKTPWPLLEFKVKRTKQTTVHIPRVKALIAKIDEHYKKKLIRRPAVERTRANLCEILSKLDEKFRKPFLQMGRGLLTENARAKIEDLIYGRPKV